jgi:RNA recognition motif-containing protein
VVKNVEVIFDRRTQRSKGFAFVEMETLDAAQKAAVALHRIEFMGRTIVVSSAKADPAASPIDAAHEKSATYISNPTPTTTPSSPIESDAKASDTSTQEAATPPAASAPPPPSPNQKLT